LKRKTARVLHFIEVLIVIFAIAIFLLANPKTLRYLTDQITSKYDLKYKSLTGNILTNIHIKDISYHDKVLSKEANIDFNLLKLLFLRLDIQKIEFLDVDMRNLKEFVNTFEKKSKKTTKTTKSKRDKALPISLKIHTITLNILPYKQDQIDIKKLKLDISNFYIGSYIDIDDVKVELLSNYFNLKYKGSYNSHSLMIDNLEVSKLDIDKLLLLKGMFKSDSDSNKTTIIKSLKVSKATLSIKPLKKSKYKIDSLKLYIKDLNSSDMKLYDIKDLNLKVKTNIWSLTSNGYVKNSTLNSKVLLSLKDKYFKKFVPFFDFNSLNPIDVKLKIDKNSLVGEVKAKSKALLTKKLDKNIKLKINSLSSLARFDFKKLSLVVDNNLSLSTKYAKNILLKGDLLYDRNNSIRYKGDIFLKDFKNLDKRVVTLLKDAKLNFKGDKKGITADLKSEYLTGRYISKGFLKPTVEISSKEFFLKDIDQNLTKKLNDLKLSFKANTTLEYKDIKKTVFDYQINSNFTDIVGSYSLQKNSTSFVTSLSKDTVLKDEKIKYENILPLKTKVDIKKDFIDINTQNDKLNIKTIYKTIDDIATVINFENSDINITKQKDTFSYDVKIDLLEDFLKSLKNYYDIKMPKLNGDFILSGNYKNKKANFTVNSNWFLYEYSKYKYFFTEKSSANLSFDEEGLKINSFDTNAFILDRYRKLFSTKTSQLTFSEDISKLTLYLNDDILIDGEFSDSTKVDIKTKSYHLKEPEADLFLDMRLRFLSSSTSSSLKGKIKLLRGSISYKPKNSHEVNDEDIVFVNKKKKKKQDTKNFDININIISKNTIKYIQDKNRFRFTHDLTLLKENKKGLQLFGYIKVIDGVYYSDDKKFELGSGEILFSGNTLNPFLNLRAYYKKDPYSITILIGGSLEAPVLNFSSSPYLTQNDILSILLFNTTASSLTDSQNQNSNPALTLFGSSFAKGIANTLGVKLDRIDLTTTKDGNIGFELEKKVGKKTTIIYQNDLVQTIKLKYQNTEHIETDLIFSPDSSGIDIIYKNEK